MNDFFRLWEIRANTPLQNGQYIIKRAIGGGGFGETYLNVINEKIVKSCRGSEILNCLNQDVQD